MSEQAEYDVAEDVVGESVDSQAEQEFDAPDETTIEPDEVVVSIGDESPSPEEEDSERAPKWVQDLRKSHRDLQRRNRELEAKLTNDISSVKPVVLGAKPTMESCGWDGDKFETELTAWQDKRREVDAAASAAQAEQAKQQQQWQATIETYGKQKSELKVKDFAEAEETAGSMLNQMQQGIILHGSANPALLVYALGKNPAKAKELSTITDPVKYAFAVAKLESQLKVSAKKAPTPERTVSGGGRVSGVVDSALDRLRTEAEKTGDYTKVVAYKRQHKDKG